MCTWIKIFHPWYIFLKKKSSILERQSVHIDAPNNQCTLQNKFNRDIYIDNKDKHVYKHNLLLSLGHKPYIVNRCLTEVEVPSLLFVSSTL